MTDVCATDAVTLAGMLRRREVSAREVTTAHVRRIEDVDGAVNAVVTRTFDAALSRAARAEVFRTRRAFRFATAFGTLLREHPGRLGANVTWNVKRGLELSVADLSRATVLHAELAGRISEFFESVEVRARRR